MNCKLNCMHYAGQRGARYVHTDSKEKRVLNITTTEELKTAGNDNIAPAQSFFSVDHTHPAIIFEGGKYRENIFVSSCPSVIHRHGEKATTKLSNKKHLY